MIATQAGVELESFERHDSSGVYRAGYDPETTPACMAVVATVAEATGVEPTEMEPLQETVEADALDELVRPEGITHGPVEVSFVFEGSAVTVASGGVVTVAPLGESHTAVRTEGETAR